MSGILRDFLKTREVILHLGAHKTATTYIQTALASERAALRARGVALLLPGDLRQEGADRKSKILRLVSHLDMLSDDPETTRIVLSEENFIGATGNNLMRQSLYPGLRRRLAKLPRALDHPNVTILFALRDYGPYLSSGVTTAVRRGKVFEHDALRAGFLPLQRSWVDVVADLRAVFPVARLRLWRYEDFIDLEPKVFSEISENLAPERQKRTFQTLSGAAMQQILEKLGNGMTSVETRQIVRQAARAYPISDKNPRFTLWSPEEAQKLSDAYERDWRQIHQAHPDIALSAD